ncbi:MAG: DUF6544 family protein [bacterium]
MRKWLLIILVVPFFLILLGIILYQISKRILYNRFKAETHDIFSSIGKEKSDIITEEHIKDLPEPVKKWLRISNVIGKERVLSVRLKQKGVFKMKVDADWTPFTSEQYYTTKEPAFIWFAELKMFKFIPIIGRDIYFNGMGNMLVKLCGIIKIADASGKEMNQGTMLRYLNETMWFPSAVLSKYIQWEPIDDNSAKATMSYKEISASAIFYFNEKGEFINFVAERYYDNDKTYKTWFTPVEKYGIVNGIKIPVSGGAHWKLESGDFKYIQLEVTDIEYNNALMFN